MKYAKFVAMLACFELAGILSALTSAKHMGEIWSLACTLPFTFLGTGMFIRWFEEKRHD